MKGSDCLNEPPSTERYAWWCERTVNKIIIYLLPDREKKAVRLESSADLCYITFDPNIR